MPESRDRLSRPVDMAELFVRYRAGILGTPSDPPGIFNLFASPSRPETTTAGADGAAGIVASGGGRAGMGGFGTPRTGNARGRGRRRAVNRTPSVGRASSRALGSNRRGSNRSVLPSWYPRTPLRDITHVVRAIERRRSRLRGIDGLDTDTPSPQDISNIHDHASTPGLDLPGQDISTITPAPNSGKKFFPATTSKVPKILQDITTQTWDGSNFITPQKKLLNSIDTVEKAVMEELDKLKQTPIAKREAREKKVRTLMSMR